MISDELFSSVGASLVVMYNVDSVETITEGFIGVEVGGVGAGRFFFGVTEAVYK